VCIAARRHAFEAWKWEKKSVFPVVGSALRAGNLNGDPKRGGHGAGEPWLSPGVLQQGDTTGEPQRGK